jgi:serine/threonine-protein kinase
MLLADQLPEPLEVETAEHVAECAECRQELESLAGDAGWWSEVQASLLANGSQLNGRQEPTSSFQGESHRSDESFTADFVVDFLQPCDRVDVLGRLGEYEILEIIGRGGMGVVLKGFQRELGRYVAVKVMAPHLATSGAARQRFIREARAAAAIVHPNVMPIHAVCTTARLPYLVMPFVTCESLQQRIDRQGALDIAEILRIGMQTVSGLAASHAQGLIHRDVKPANILLEKGVDRVLLTDFGLARAVDDASLTRTGIVAGTPQYMSPEQARGDAIDARSDLFSLGSVLYAASTGRPPFRAESTLAVLRRITDSQPRPAREINPNVPEWLGFVLDRLHEKSPERRFASATEVAALLEQCLAHVQQPTATPLPPQLHRTRSTASACWRRLAAIVGVVLSALSLSILLFTLSIARVKDQDEGTQKNGAEIDSSAARLTTAKEDRSHALELSDESISNDVQRFDIELRELERRTAQDGFTAPSNNGSND